MLIAIIAFVLIVSVGVGGFVWWRFGVPAAGDTLGPMNRLAEENAGGMAIDSPDNALHHYRAIVLDDLGLAAAEEYDQPRDSGNRRFAIWRRWHDDDVYGELLWGDGAAFARPEIVADLEELRPILTRLDRAADAGAFRALYTASGDIFKPGPTHDPMGDSGVLVPQVGMYRRLGQLNAVRLRASVVHDDWTGLVRSTRTGLRHARHIAAEPYLMAGITALTCDEMTFDEIAFAALKHELPLDVCRDLIDELDEAGPLTLEDGLKGEVVFLPSVFSYMITSRWDDGPLWTADFWRSRFDQPPPRVAIHHGMRYLRVLASIATLPWHERTSHTMPPKGAATNFVDMYERALREGDRRRTQRAAVRLLLLLERHHALTGQWPAALEDIMPREETLDPNTLTPFVYALTPEGPFPFSLAAPPEADFLLPDQRLFTQPRPSINEQNLSIDAAP